MYDLDWRVVHAEFEQRTIRCIEQYFEDSAVVVAPLDVALRASPHVCDVEDLTNVLVSLWKSFAMRPRFVPIFAVFAYVRCQLAWELTVDHETITSVIVAILRSWEHSAHLFGAADRLAADIMVHHTHSMVSCMAAENAVQCSCPVDLSIQADRVVQECTHEIARSDGLLGTEWEDLTKYFMRPVLRAHQLTYEGHSQAATAVLAWIERGREAAPLLRQAEAVLQRAEQDWAVTRDVYAGELRAQRSGLNALLAYIEDPKIPEIQFGDARVAYIYPFTIPGLNGKNACALAEALLPGALGDGRRFRVLETMLTDVWSGHGRQRSKYGGISLFLPSLSVITTGGDILEHAVEVRLSNLGNHYIRIHRTITDATLHDINQVLRRVSTAMGLESVREHGSDHVERKRLPDYAVYIATLLIRALRESSARIDGSVSQRREFTAEEYGELRSVIDIHLHVVLEIRKGSILDSEVSGRAASTSEVLRAADALFRSPVQRLPTALEEWAKSEVGTSSTLMQKESMPNLFGKSHFPNEFIGTTYNSTVIVMPDTPNWILLEYVELVEFAASLPPLIANWKKWIDDAVADDSRDLRRLSSVDLANRRFELQALVGGIRDEVAVLNSIDLCSTLSNRQFLDSLYEAGGLSELQAELDSTIARVESTYERMTSLITQRDERRNRRYQVVVEIILAILAASSLAEVVGLGNNLLNLKGVVVAIWEVGGIALVAILTSVLIFIRFKLRDD